MKDSYSMDGASKTRGDSAGPDSEKLSRGDGGGAANDDDSSAEVPKQLRELIPPDVWGSFSLVRRKSFNLMFVNPNAFFYRNRPPGEAQRLGAFSEDEERQFMERLRYFHEDLKIHNGKWGLFAIPIRGRVGYQCSNFYRALIEAGKVADPSYERDAEGRLRCVQKPSMKVSGESLRRLELEAEEFIKECLKGVVSEETAKMVEQERVRRRRKVWAEPVDVRKEQQAADEDAEECDDPSELVNAMDSVTRMPMKHPYMDRRSGVVLDLETWRKVFTGQNTSVPTRACHFGQLIKMTKRNFRKYWMDIVNVNI